MRPGFISPAVVSLSPVICISATGLCFGLRILQTYVALSPILFMTARMQTEANQQLLCVKQGRSDRPHLCLCRRIRAVRKLRWLYWDLQPLMQSGQMSMPADVDESYLCFSHGLKGSCRDCSRGRAGTPCPCNGCLCLCYWHKLGRQPAVVTN